MTSSILQTATRFLMPLLLLFALFLLWRGHNEPGGGFVGGLVAAAAFVLYAMAYGVDAGRRALLVDPTTLLGGGLLVAFLSGVPAVLTGRAFMTGLWMRVGVGSAVVDVGTPLVFDVGVLLTVTGVVLTIVFTLADVTLAEE
jgi:multisubunit Na+/H+ antiporter MnhB subunit